MPDFTGCTHLAVMARGLVGLLDPDGQTDLVRHGEAHNKKVSFGGIDFNRHLTPTGLKQVRYLGTKIAKNNYDLAVTTAAPRAIQTLFGALVEDHPPEKIPPIHIASGSQLYGPSNPEELAEFFRVADKLGHSRYGEYTTNENLHRLRVWDHFAMQTLEALQDIPKLGTAKRIFLSGHGLLGSCVAEAILAVYTGGSISNEDRRIIYDTEVPLCGVFEISKAGVKVKTYI